MPKLSEETRNRIALKLLVHLMIKEDIIPDQTTMKRELPNTARSIQEKPEDLIEFAHWLFPQLIAGKYKLSDVQVKFDGEDLLRVS